MKRQSADCRIYDSIERLKVRGNNTAWQNLVDCCVIEIEETAYGVILHVKWKNTK